MCIMYLLFFDFLLKMKTDIELPKNIRTSPENVAATRDSKLRQWVPSGVYLWLCAG